MEHVVKVLEPLKAVTLGMSEDQLYPLLQPRDSGVVKDLKAAIMANLSTRFPLIVISM